MHDFTYYERMTTAHESQAPQLHPSLDTFGARLAIIRWAMRWNLKEAALACNVPQASWREWELFDRAPRNLVEVSAKIAARTGYDDYWIMTGSTKAPVDDEGLDAVRRQGLEPRTRYVDATASETGIATILLADSNPDLDDSGFEGVADVIQLPTWRNQPGVIREAVAR